MNTASQYAKSLYELMDGHPGRGATYLKNLREALTRRGHQKLLPRIFSEYKKLELHRERFEKYKEMTPKMQKQKILVELYQKLVSTK